MSGTTTTTTADQWRAPRRLRWALADGWTITLRDLKHWAAQPWQIVFGLLFSVMLVLMFGYLFGGAIEVPGGGDYREFLMPGMFALTMLFGLEATYTAVTTDADRGVTDRFRAMPMAGSAVVVGRASADMLNSVVTLVAMAACGLAVGWRWHEGIGKMLAGFGLLLLLRFALLWVGIYLGLVARGTGPVTAAQALEFPVAFLSGVFFAPAAMPAVVSTIAEWNPLTATAAAARELFGNPGWGGDSWVAQHPVLMAVAWPLVIIAVFAPLSVHRYREMSR
jgi:ABC-2 type transport system permease protein